MTRAIVKLLEYIEKRKNAGGAISSSTYDAKDLMRMSYVCRNAEETRAIFKALTNQKNEMFSVYQIKNGFEK